MTTEQRGKLVDRVAQVIDERINLVRWFRQNACMKHGLPLDETAPIRVEVNHTGNVPQGPSPIPAPAPAATASATVTTAAPVAPSITDIAGKLPIVGEPRGKVPAWLWATLASLALSGGGLAAYLNWPESKEPVQQAEPYEPDLSGSLLQDLQDRGFHTPGEQWQTTQ